MDNEVANEVYWSVVSVSDNSNTHCDRIHAAAEYGIIEDCFCDLPL